VNTTTLSNPTGKHYNGLNIGSIAIVPPATALPDSAQQKIGDLYLKMSPMVDRDSLMPDNFDIVIDSAFYPPAGIFKFTEQFMASGFPPVFVKGTMHVIASPPEKSDSDTDPNVPLNYELSQNYPNPFNPSTTVAFTLKSRGFVDLSIYNVLGQKVKTLVSGELDAGQHEAVWDGTDESGDEVSSGMYFYKIDAGEFVKTKKMLMLK
jgi:hypothetical protein